MLLIIFFSYGYHIAVNTLVGYIEQFGAIVNLLSHNEFLFMYAKLIPFLVGSTNVYGILFYQVYLLPQITIPFFTWYCGIMVIFYLAVGSPQHLYQCMQNCVVIRLMKLRWINSSDKIIPNSICIIFWRIVCMVSIKEELIPNPPFQYSGPLLVILSVSSNVYFGATR